MFKFTGCKGKPHISDILKIDLQQSIHVGRFLRRMSLNCWKEVVDQLTVRIPRTTNDGRKLMCLVTIVANFLADRIFVNLFKLFSPLPKILLLAMLFLTASDGGLERFEDVLKLPEEGRKMRPTNHKIDLCLIPN